MLQYILGDCSNEKLNSLETWLLEVKTVCSTIIIFFCVGGCDVGISCIPSCCMLMEESSSYNHIVVSGK